MHQEVSWEVGKHVLQVEQKDLVDHDAYDHENEAKVVVHSYRRGQEDKQGYDQDAKVKLLDLEIVGVNPLSEDVKFLTAEQAIKRRRHLQHHFIEGAESCVQEENVY